MPCNKQISLRNGKFIKVIKKSKKTKKDIDFVTSFVKEKGGIKYAEEKMHFFKDKAKNILNNIQSLSSTDYIQALIDFVYLKKKVRLSSCCNFQEISF